MSVPHDTLNLPRALGDGLVLRLATPTDVEAIVELNTHVLLDEDEPDQALADWTRDLMSGCHPTTTAADFIVVEDTKTAKIVSSTCLIPQVWTYEDIPFPVGRPELVATDPAYRRRGLIRAIFAAIHTLSNAYGHLVQGITGIPWFYRQFGYEFALSLGGAHNLNINQVPALKEGETEAYQIRPATEADIPDLMRLYQRQCQGRLVTTLFDETCWRYDLGGRRPGSLPNLHIYCLLESEARVIGYYITSAHLWHGHLTLFELGTAEGVPLHAILPSVARALKAQAQVMAAENRDNKDGVTTIQLMLGMEHPAYEVFKAKLGPFQPPYGWYIRVADVPRFIRHIAPVLERRLANSVMSGFSGGLKITFYQSGLGLVFEHGKLVEASDWPPPETNEHWDGAGFPPLVFLQLLFGHRSLAELRYAFPDCWADEEPTLLLNVLFPKRVSWVEPLG